MADRLRITTTGGKYTVIQTEKGNLTFLRHGEEWPAANRDFAHVGMILALAQEIEALRDRLKAGHLHGCPFGQAFTCERSHIGRLSAECFSADPSRYCRKE
jgi:hypothetical protein